MKLFAQTLSCETLSPNPASRARLLHPYPVSFAAAIPTAGKQSSEPAIVSPNTSPFPRAVTKEIRRDFECLKLVPWSKFSSAVTGGNKGLPAKNLMAERRRRKKHNDRLYMLRSVVPKIRKDWTGMNFRQIMDEVEKIKGTGNRLFKEGKYELSKAKYDHFSLQSSI